MFGYDLTDEVTGNPSEYTHPDDLQMVLSEMGKIFGDPTYVPTLVYRFVDKTGQWHWVETTFSNLLANPSVASIVLNFHDITERKLMEDAQAFLLQISNPGSDENFFESLAKYLAQCLDMQYVCIDLLEGDRLTAKTLAIYNEGNFDLNVSYALKDTPCGEVVGNHICCYPQKVRNLFPNDLALEDIKAESYIGTTLWSFDGKPIGLIAVIGQQPLQNQELAASLLKLVSLRAAGKLEAMLAEEKVKESEERFRVLIESTSVAIYLTDLHGKCTYVNPKWCEMAQLSYHQAMGDGWINGIYKEDREKVFEKWQQMVATDVNWSLEYRFGTPEKISWVYGTAKSYKNDSGQIAGFIGSNVDITERKLSEAIIRDIIEKNPMSIQILDMEGYPIQVNSAHTKLFGVKPPADYSVMQDQQLLALGFGKLFEQIKKGEVVYFPDSYYNVHDVNPTYPDSPAWVKALGFTLNDNNGNPSKIVLMHENITERKNAEALLNDIIDNNPMSIQVVDKAGITRRGNPAFVELFGAVPPPGFSIFDDLSRKSSELDSLVTQVLQGEIVHLPDIYFNAHDAITEAPDIPLWIRALIFPLRDTSGKPERFVFMHENITERKIAEQELIKAKDRAEESDRLKSAFLANMSHEIRTPMNGILGFSELLKEPGLTGDQQQVYIGIIEKSGLRMLNIINNIIDISKIEAGLVKLYIKESNINEQFEFIYTFFKPEVEAKGMKLTFKNSLASKEAIIHTDAEKLYAILTNLVKNAIKYTNEGSIEIGYNMVETLHATSPNATSPHSLLFYVKDTGIGIPKERQAAIFERFIQADISDKMAYQGAGLGLAITKAYVEMLGGKIWVESEVGRGSAFYFTLPYHAELHEKKAVGKVVALANERNQVNPKVSGLKIVIAEDDETSEMFISITLREFGKEIIKIKTGMEAVEICRNRPDIDLILMDIQMPGLSGYEAAKLIRQFNKNVVIIAQTAFGMSGDREKAINSGCNGYLAKPIDKNELFALIQLYFRK
jgi:PAS domain S-box-containing protein